MQSLFTFLMTFLVATPMAYGNDNLKPLFSQMEKNSKGPFGLNYLQGTKSRTTVRSGKHPSGKFLFQAAYRNEDARELVEKNNFYTGNLFTANYYELMGRFFYGITDGSYSLEHQGLIEQGSQAMTMATKMVNHWILEKYYISVYPNSGLAKGFGRRGIGGSEFEQEYAIYFFNFYLSSLQDDYQFLPAFLLAKQSPISDSRVLSEVRKLIEESYDYFAGVYGSSDSRVRGLYRIRNAIHNQISEQVLAMIEDYLRANPWYEAQGNTYLQKIHRLLSRYFNLGADEIQKQAKGLNLDLMAKAAANIKASGVDKHTVLDLSATTAYYRTEIANSNLIPSDSKAEVLALLAKTSQYIGKELIRMGEIDSTEKATALINIIYIEGYLIQDNWEYYLAEVGHSSLSQIKSLLMEVNDVANMTLEEVIYSDLKLWKSVSPDSKMDQFIDDTLKSSALNTLSVTLK